MNRVIQRFAKPYTYQRPGAGSMVKGRWADGPLADPVEIQASIQPLSGRQLQLLPESERTTEQVNVFTDSQMQVLNTSTKVKGDILTYNGRTWEIQAQENWDLNDYPFYVFRARLIEADAD